MAVVPIRGPEAVGGEVFDNDSSIIDGGVDAFAVSPGEPASDVKACSSSLGRLRPRLDARRRMPVAARADSENRCGALGCNTSRRVVGFASQTEDEDPSSALGHSEVASVEDPVRHAIPEFCHLTEEARHVSPAMTGEESRYVFEEDGGRSVSLHKAKERKGEVAAGACDHAPSLPGDAEVLARKTAGPEMGAGPNRIFGSWWPRWCDPLKASVGDSWSAVITWS